MLGFGTFAKFKAFVPASAYLQNARSAYFEEAQGHKPQEPQYITLSASSLANTLEALVAAEGMAAAAAKVVAEDADARANWSTLLQFSWD